MEDALAQQGINKIANLNSRPSISEDYQNISIFRKNLKKLSLNDRDKHQTKSKVTFWHTYIELYTGT